MQPLNLHVKNPKDERHWLVVHNPQQSPTLETSIAGSNQKQITFSQLFDPAAFQSLSANFKNFALREPTNLS